MYFDLKSNPVTKDIFKEYSDTIKQNEVFNKITFLSRREPFYLLLLEESCQKESTSVMD